MLDAQHFIQVVSITYLYRYLWQYFCNLLILPNIFDNLKFCYIFLLHDLFGYYFIVTTLDWHLKLWVWSRRICICQINNPLASGDTVMLEMALCFGVSISDGFVYWVQALLNKPANLGLLTQRTRADRPAGFTRIHRSTRTNEAQ